MTNEESPRREPGADDRGSGQGDHTAIVGRLEFIPGEVQGLETLFVVPALPESAPPAIREGIVRRRIATISGKCPCGGRRARLNRADRRRIARSKDGCLSAADITHEDDCPAISEDVAAYLRGWRWSR